MIRELDESNARMKRSDGRKLVLAKLANLRLTFKTANHQIIIGGKKRWAIKISILTSLLDLTGVGVCSAERRRARRSPYQTIKHSFVAQPVPQGHISSLMQRSGEAFSPAYETTSSISTEESWESPVWPLASSGARPSHTSIRALPLAGIVALAIASAVGRRSC